VKGVVNDVGIVYPKDKDPYIVCVFTKGIAGWEKGLQFVADGEEAIAKVSKAAYEEFVCQ